MAEIDTLIITAKYKGDTNERYTHGISYFLEIAEGPANTIIIDTLKENGDQWYAVQDPVFYNSFIDFLIRWEEISSYPTLPTFNAKPRASKGS